MLSSLDIRQTALATSPEQLTSHIKELCDQINKKFTMILRTYVITRFE